MHTFYEPGCSTPPARPVSPAEVKKALQTKPLEMQELQSQLGGVQSEGTIWDMIDQGEIRVNVDLTLCVA